MEIAVERPTKVGLGFATHPDAFQCGREAAQQAKNQLPEGRVNLVLIFGPGTVHFKDFVEGVRLVMGEETLVAVPSSRVLSNESTVTDACIVAAFQSSSMRISIAADETADGTSSQATTSLITQFRHLRGNAFREFAHRGSLVFSHRLPENGNRLASNMAADMGLESWLVGSATDTELEASLFCSSRTIHQGLVGVEFLSMQPLGMGSVATGPFSSKPDFIAEALKTAMREAAQQLTSKLACFGLVLFDLSSTPATALPKDILMSAAAVLPQVPLLGINTRRHFVRRLNRTSAAENDSIVVLLVPA